MTVVMAKGHMTIMTLQQEMEAALQRLKCVFPKAVNRISLELTHHGRPDIISNCFYASSTDGLLFTGASDTPNHAVNTFLEVNGITRVEEYVRTQAYHDRRAAND